MRFYRVLFDGSGILPFYKFVYSCMRCIVLFHESIYRFVNFSQEGKKISGQSMFFLLFLYSFLCLFEGFGKY